MPVSGIAMKPPYCAAPTPSQEEAESVVGRQLKAALLGGADASYAVGARRFFKLAYCPDDVFIGLKVPVCRAIVREHLSRTDAGVIGELVRDNRHEMRMAGFMCLVESYIAPSKSSWAHHEDEDAARQAIVTEYLSSLKYCDNWDLVDMSCSKILGDWLVRQHAADIEGISTAASTAPGGTNSAGLSAEAVSSLPDWYQALLRSGDFWEVRVSVVLLLGAVLKCNTTFAFLVCKWHLDRLQQADLVLAINGMPFADRDLVHKALGWVLREAGKLDRPQLVSFLNSHAAQCHRTTMRYATEHFDRAAAKRLVALAQPTSAAAAATAATVLLQKRTAALERDIGTFYATKTDLQDAAQSLQEEERQDCQARRDELAKIRKQLNSRRAVLKQIREKVDALAAGLSAPDDLQGLMEQLETMLSAFRRGMRLEFESLSAQERSMTRELQAATTRFEDWAKPTQDASADDADTHNSSRVPTLARSRLSDTVAATLSLECTTERDVAGRIDAIIRNEGGATGGWPQHQHDTFLRLWTQVNKGDALVTRETADVRRRKVAALLSRAATALVERDSSEVEDHFAWYVRHLEYARQKRELVAAWRERRAQERAEKALADEAAAEASQSAAAAAAAAAERVQQQRDKKRSTVRAWQEQRQSREVEEEAAKAAAAEAERVRLEAERQRQRKVRQEVAAYRAERVREQQRLETARRMMRQEARRASQADIVTRAQADVEAARLRREELERLAEEKRHREDALLRGTSARWQCTVRADPDRLVGATKAVV
ncbi:DNA alkylation repair enzyme-domain-containing protein [Tribonema minus]|uniref:DNA alkylation repair enzyme-domain-containing protein n=1 Tax=Tribonema minus TaxID=303371 RepID=A0A836CGE1_9STRA|nr:DNA alkylation repair enzyme-domain-containing protein [Tribonema minus]